MTTPPVLISREHLERLAWRTPSAVTEFTEDAAFLTLGDRTYYALLTPRAELHPLPAQFEAGSCGHVATRCECVHAASVYYGRP